MRSIYDFHNRLRKATLQPGYTEWLERFVIENKRITDYVNDSFFASQLPDDKFKLSLLSAFSSLVLEYAERIGLKDFDIQNDFYYWSANLTLLNGTPVLIQVVENETLSYTVVSLREPGEAEFDISDLIEVFCGKYSS